jgi:DNA-binding transcriptional regulator YhcF (GntR family)
MSWFYVSSSVIDRDDLNVYEKMCYVILSSAFQSDNEEMSLDDLAKKMGVEEIVAKGAFHALRAKGILVALDPEIRPGTIIKADQVEDKVKPFTLDDKIASVFEIIDERINEREAKIILNFAGGDLEKIKAKYKIAKSTQYNDKIEVLIHELQKKTTGRIIKKEAAEEVIKPFEAIQVEERQSSQVNTYKLNLMKKYKKK